MRTDLARETIRKRGPAGDGTYTIQEHTFRKKPKMKRQDHRKARNRDATNHSKRKRKYKQNTTRQRGTQAKAIQVPKRAAATDRQRSRPTHTTPHANPAHLSRALRCLFNPPRPSHCDRRQPARGSGEQRPRPRARGERQPLPSPRALVFHALRQVQALQDGPGGVPCCGGAHDPLPGAFGPPARFRLCF